MIDGGGFLKVAGNGGSVVAVCEQDSPYQIGADYGEHGFLENWGCLIKV